MKLKFETVFRSYFIILVVLLLWSFWSHGQQTTNRNAQLESSAKAANATVKLPVLIEKDVFLTFGLDKVPYLQPELWGNPRWQYIASLIYILLAFYISKVLDYLTCVWLKKWARKTATRFDDLLLELVNGPVKIVSFVILLQVGLNVFTWPDWVNRLFAKGLHLIVACSLTYVAVKFVDLLMGYWRARVAGTEDKSFDEQLFPIVRKSFKVFIIVVAVLVTSQNLGLNITSVIASLSIGGLALGLAAQDTLANLFGAVAIFIDKPFRIGDRIKLEAIEGDVETIGMRSTRIRNLEGHLITVPNKTMGNATITNVTRRPNIKTEMNLGLTYDTPAEKVKRALDILEETYRKHPMTGDLIVSFNKFADSSLNILVVHWWKSTDMKAYLAGMQELNLMVKKRFDEERISFAFPSSTIYLKQDSEWRIENGPERSGPAQKG